LLWHTVLSAEYVSKRLCTRCSARFKITFGSAFFERTVSSSLLPWLKVLSKFCILPSVESSLCKKRRVGEKFPLACLALHHLHKLHI